MTKSFTGFVGWLRGSVQAEPSHCRLTENEALDIAARTVTSAAPLTVLRVIRSAQRLIWVIGTATVGRGEYVRVDDEAGEVIDRGKWGKR